MTIAIAKRVNASVVNWSPMVTRFYLSATLSDGEGSSALYGREKTRRDQQLQYPLFAHFQAEWDPVHQEGYR